MSYPNGGMAKSRSNGDQPMPMSLGGNPATEPPGGNKTLINMNEAAVLDATIEDSPFRAGPLSNEDDSHVTGVYAEPDFAGS